MFTSYRNVIDSLSGITTGVGSQSSHVPLATRVELKFLGKDIDKRQALKACGLFDVSSDAIDQDIKDRIKNEILPHEIMLTARDSN